MGLIRPRYHAAAAVLILVACVGVQGLLAPRSASAAASLRAARVPSVAGGPLNRHRLQLNRDGHRPPQCAGSMCHAAGAHHSCFVLGAAALPAIPSWLTTLLSYLLPTKFELEMLCRLILAAALGTLIGWERRNSHRPAGVRTMSLVATGAAIFSIVSSYGFSRGDPSRVAANICSGVGFLGAGVITSDASKRSDRRGGDTVKQDYESEVRGLTTAASIWITAGLGMAAGTGLYFAAISGSAVTVLVLEMNRMRKYFKLNVNNLTSMSWNVVKKSQKRKKTALPATTAVAAATSNADENPPPQELAPTAAPLDEEEIHLRRLRKDYLRRTLGGPNRRSWPQSKYFSYLDESESQQSVRSIRKRVDWDMPLDDQEDFSDELRPEVPESAKAPPAQKVKKKSVARAPRPVSKSKHEYLDIDLIKALSKEKGESLDY